MKSEREDVAKAIYALRGELNILRNQLVWQEGKAGVATSALNALLRHVDEIVAKANHPMQRWVTLAHCKYGYVIGFEDGEVGLVTENVRERLPEADLRLTIVPPKLDKVKVPVSPTPVWASYDDPDPIPFRCIEVDPHRWHYLDDYFKVAYLPERAEWFVWDDKENDL